METHCPRCGELVLTHHEYCKNCGEKLLSGPPTLLILYGCGCTPLLIMGGCALGSLDRDPHSGLPINLSWFFAGVALAIVGFPVMAYLNRVLRPPRRKL